MTSLYLRPQWHIFQDSTGEWSIINEASNTWKIPMEEVDLLLRLVDGVDASTLSEKEFEHTQRFHGRGLLSTESNPNSATWELAGVNSNTVREQLIHNKVRIVDNTKSGDGKHFTEIMENSKSVIVSKDAALGVLLADSFTDVPDYEGSAICVILGRARVSVGPMVFPWRVNVRKIIEINPAYIREPRYTISEPFRTLGISWAASTVATFLASTSLLYVNNTVEFNVATQEKRIWPMQH